MCGKCSSSRAPKQPSCRSALERAVDKGGSRLVWRWQSGERTEVRFRRQNHHMTMLVRQRQAA